MNRNQRVALLVVGALVLIASPASAAWVCTARNDAGRKWTVTKENPATAAALARQLYTARGPNNRHCVIDCHGGGWSIS
jgi:hypothetical protein